MQNVGQSYLERKAYQAPYQLENLAKKQFVGSDKPKDKVLPLSAAGSQTESHRARSAAPSERSSTVRKDAEIANLKKQLETYELDKGRSMYSRSLSASRGEHSQAPTKASRKSSLVNWDSDILGGRLGKGQISKPKRHSESSRQAPQLAKGANRLAVPDTRLEKDGTLTGRKNKTIVEADGLEAGKRERERNSAASYRGVHHERSLARSTHRGRSPTGASQAETSHKHSAASSSSAHHLGASPTRSLASHGSTLKGSSARRSSLGSSDASSTVKGGSVRRSSLSSSHRSSMTSLDEASEHGGSAALLHQRQRYHRSYSRGHVPELPPLERRPEVIGGGFRPHRSPVEREVGIVEVFEETPRRAPRARQVGRRREYEAEKQVRDYKEVVEIGSERGGRTLYKVC